MSDVEIVLLVALVFQKALTWTAIGLARRGRL